jgi:hypothetical protein
VLAPFPVGDSLLAVPVAGDHQVRVFDARGNLVATYGREGEGPGEFRALGAAWARGDTVEAFDPGLRRVTRFAAGSPPAAIVLEAVGSAQAAAGMMADGSWVLFGVKNVSPTGRDRVAVHLFASSGEHLGEVHETDGMLRIAIGGGRRPDPLSPRAVVRTRGDTILVAETVSGHVTMISRADGAVGTLSVEALAAARPAAVPAEARDALLDALGSDEQKALVAARLDAVAGDDELSVIWDVLVDELGFWWVRPYEPARHAVDIGGLGSSGSGGVWLIHAPDGTYLSPVELPDDFELTGITTRTVLGIRRDAYGVESVRVYPLVRH